MKNFLRPLALALSSSLLCAGLTVAGPVSNSKNPVTAQTTEIGAVALDLFDLESAVTFGSDLNHGGSLGSQTAFQNRFEYGHRFQLRGPVYLRLGLAYERFDFTSTRAPVPIHLQSAAAVIGLDYLQGSDLGAFIQVRPGFYFEEHLGEASFDVPITAARIFVLQPDKLYFLAGANAAFLRGGTPVIPLAGVIWRPSKEWTLNGILPEPRLIYSPNEKLDLYVGGEVAGGSFRTDHHDTIVPPKLNGTQVDYTDYRTGVGLAWSPVKEVSLDLSGGYSIQRDFKYHRAGENYRTDPAPYLRLEFRARF